MKSPTKPKNPKKVAQGQKLQAMQKKKHQSELIKEIDPILKRFHQRITILESQPKVIEKTIIRGSRSSYSFNPKFKLSLFDNLMQTKLFPIEIKEKEENLSINEILKKIWKRLNNHFNFISILKN